MLLYGISDAKCSDASDKSWEEKLKVKEPKIL
jgi:hypothetical protein